MGREKRPPPPRSSGLFYVENMNYGGSPLNAYNMCATVLFALNNKKKYTGKTRKKKQQQQAFKHVAWKDEDEKYFILARRGTQRLRKARVYYSL